MRESILRWFTQGQVGVSSKALASAIIDIELSGHDKYHNHPHDPDDFNRCLLFLSVVPEARNHLDKVRKLSPEWNSIIERWDDVEFMFITEVGLNWEHGTNAPKTYELMQEIIGEATE